jgi:hypothetical protein
VTDGWPAIMATRSARATLGGIEIFAAGHPLRLVEDKCTGAVHSFANRSAYDLALWFAANWWRLRREPERAGTDWAMSHRLAAIGGGYV